MIEIILGLMVGGTIMGTIILIINYWPHKPHESKTNGDAVK